MTHLIQWLDATAALECGEHFHVDLRTGAVIGRFPELEGVGRSAPRILRRYDSRSPEQRPSLGVGWSLAHDEIAPTTAATGVQLDVRLGREGVAAIDATMRRARVCVRRFEMSAGQLLRVRDERERVIEEYEYDGPLLVAARSYDTPWRYFEYDDRGRRARCVRTWSATGKRDRRITYAGHATVVDDATGATWILERGGPELALLDPEMRRSIRAVDTDHGPGGGADLGCQPHFDASGAIVALDLPGVGRLAARTDAIGRVTELHGSNGERVVWQYEHDRTIAHASGAPGPASRLELSRTGLIRGLRDGRSGRTLSAEYDGDGSLAALTIGESQALIENDAEGRAIVVRQGGELDRTIVRDRAGHPIAIESVGGGARRKIDPSKPLTDDDFVRSVLADETGAASVRDRLRPGSIAHTEQHVRTTLASARVLGRFEKRCGDESAT